MTATTAPARKTAPKRVAVVTPPAMTSKGDIRIGMENDKRPIAYELKGAKLQLIEFEGHGIPLGVGAKVYRLCWKCNRSGNLGYHRNVYGGICFACNGAGYTSIFAETVEEAGIKAARQIAADERREARRLAQAEADRIQREAEFTAWLAANKAFVVKLAKFIKTNKLAKQVVRADGFVRDAHKDDVELIYFADTILTRNTLTDKQMEFVSDLINRVAARKAAGEATRYAADEGARITFTGKVTRSIHLEPRDVGYGNVSYRRMILIDGTGDWAGCIFKWIGTSNLAFELEEDQDVTLKATVKQ